MVKIENLRNVMIAGRRYKRRINLFGIPGPVWDTERLKRIEDTVASVCTRRYRQSGMTFYFECKHDAIMVALAL